MRIVVISRPADRAAQMRRQLATVSQRVFWTSMLVGIPAVVVFVFLVRHWQQGPLALRYYLVLLLPFVFPLAAIAIVARTYLPLGLRLDELGISLREGPFVRRIAWTRVESIGFLRQPRSPGNPIFHADSYSGQRIRFEVSAEDRSQIELYVQQQWRCTI